MPTSKIGIHHFVGVNVIVQPKTVSSTCSLALSLFRGDERNVSGACGVTVIVIVNVHASRVLL